MSFGLKLNYSSEKYEPRSSFSLQVGVGEFIETNGNLATYGVGPCIALVGYNSETQNGLIGHFSTLDNSDSEWPQECQLQQFQEALYRTRVTLGHTASTFVWLGGGAPSLSGDKDTTKPDREIAKKLVNNTGLPKENIRVSWSPEGIELALELRCSLATLAIHRFDGNFDQLYL